MLNRKRSYKQHRYGSDDEEEFKLFPPRTIIRSGVITCDEKKLCDKFQQFSMMKIKPVNINSPNSTREYFPQDLLMPNFPPISSTKLAAFQLKASLKNQSNQLSETAQDQNSRTKSPLIIQEENKVNIELKFGAANDGNADEDEKKKRKRTDEEDVKGENEDGEKNEEENSNEDDENDEEGDDYDVYAYADGGLETGDDFGANDYDDDDDGGGRGDDDGPTF